MADLDNMTVEELMALAGPPVAATAAPMASRGPAGFTDMGTIYTGSGSDADPSVMAAPTIAPQGNSLDGMSVEQLMQIAGPPKSDFGAIRNAAMKGLGGTLSLLDEALPGFNEKAIQPGNRFGMVPPHLWGLFGTPKPQGANFGKDVARIGKDIGLINNSVAASEYGKFGENVAENAAAAGPFGPLATLAGAVLGGTGGYVGEKAGDALGYPQVGKAVGSFLGPVTPAGFSKLGVAKELAETFGPTLSQLPLLNRVLGKPSIDAAVGRAILKSAGAKPGSAEADDLAKSLISTVDDSGKLPSEITGNTGIAQAEDGVANIIPNSGLKELAAGRAAQRADDVKGVVPGFNPKATDYDISKTAEGVIEGSVDNFSKVEKAAWKLLPKDEPIPISGIDDLVKEGLAERFLKLDDVPQVKSALAEIAKETSENGLLPLGRIQKLRSSALALARESNDANVRYAAKQLADKLAFSVDRAASIGFTDPAVGKVWEGARALTKTKKEAFGQTKSLEKLALDGEALDNTALYREALTSPDKMASHLAAAKLGGGDLAPTYRQMLMSELQALPQSKWAGYIADKKNLFKQVFSDDELNYIRKNTDSIASEIAKGNIGITNSRTNFRGNIQDTLMSEKGIARLANSAWSQTPAIAGGYLGATEGWKSGDTTFSKLSRALLGGVGGVVLGKGLKNASSRASESFDQLLVEAVKDPAEMARVIKAATPSNFSKVLGKSLVGGAEAAATKTSGTVLNSLVKSTLGDKALPKKEEKKKPEKVAMATIDDIKADPLDHAIALTESNLDPKAKNKASSASGIFQLTSSTAKALGVKDVFDADENYAGYKKLLAEHKARFGDDPETLYAAHYLGAPLLAKVQSNRVLTATEKEIVQEFLNKALPNFQKNYDKVTSA